MSQRDLTAEADLFFLILLSSHLHAKSTSDDSLRYRSVEEVEHFAHCDPLNRLQAFFKRHHYDGMESNFPHAVADQEKMAVLDAMKKAERKPKPSLNEMFEDVFYEMPASLKVQQQELHAHIAKYPNQY
jgi:2-oxoisovalerate dehydrogenase E1 component alpha subunit